VFVKRVLDRRPAVLLAARGTGVVHPTAAVNTAALIETVAQRPGARILNSADPDAPSALEIGRTIARQLGRAWNEVLLDDASAAPGLGGTPWDSPHPVVLDTTASLELGYKPVGDYAATVADEVDWLFDLYRAGDPDGLLPAADDGFFAGYFDYAAEDAYLAGADRTVHPASTSVPPRDEELADAARGEQVPRGEPGRAEDSGLLAEHRGLDPQAARGQRQGPAVDDAADVGQQVLVQLGEHSPDDDRVRVVEGDQRGEHLADALPGEPHPAARDGMALGDEPDDVAGAARVEPLGPQRRRDRRAGGDGLDAARVAAVAEHVVVAGQPDVPDVPGRARRAAMQHAAGDDAAADAGADLHVEQVLRLAAVHVLAERHHVDVVVHQHRRRVSALEERRDPVAVPALHDRRPHDRAALRLDRPRHADPDGAQAGRGELRGPAELSISSPTPPRMRSGPSLMSISRAVSASTRPPSVVSAIRLCVAPRSTPTTTASSRGEFERVRRPAPVGGQRLALDQQPALDQQVHPLGDGRAGQPGGRDQRAARGAPPSATRQASSLSAASRRSSAEFTAFDATRAPLSVAPTSL
jgi:hypothetical protein